MGLLTNWMLAIALALYDGVFGLSGGDGPLTYLVFFGVGGAVVGSLLGALVGMLLGSLFGVTKSTRFAKWVTPVLLILPVIVGELSVGINANHSFIALCVVILITVGVVGGVVFERACRFESMDVALGLTKRSCEEGEVLQTD